MSTGEPEPSPQPDAATPPSPAPTVSHEPNAGPEVRAAQDQDQDHGDGEPKPEAEGPEAGEPEAEEPKKKLNLAVDISTVGPCKKHVKVTIPAEDIRDHFNNQFTELVQNAAVRGFRPGHAPRRLVERRFRREVSDQVKASLLMESLEQLAEDYQLDPLTQPELDIKAIEVPEDGPMHYELDLEVRPEFDLPDYRGLTIQRPVKTFTDQDVEKQLKAFLGRSAALVPKIDAGAAVGDTITADLTFKRGDEVLNTATELSFQLQPRLRFRDGEIDDLDQVLAGVRPGDQRTAPARIADTAPDASLRGQTVEVVFDVKDLKTLKFPHLDAHLLARFGFDREEELREEVRRILERRLEYEQRRLARQQVLQALTQAVDLSLPEDLVRRQEASTLEQQVLELRNAGYTEAEIRAREVELRRNSHRTTEQALRERFLLEKIAESEAIEVTPADIDREIREIADQSNESPRRVRAQLEHKGLMDALTSQILERKALERVLEYATYEDVPLAEEPDTEAVDQPALSSAAPAAAGPETAPPS